MMSFWGGANFKRTTSSLLRSHSLGSFSRLVFESEINNGPIDGESRDWSFRVAQTIVLLLRLFTPFSYAVLAAALLLPRAWVDAARTRAGGALTFNALLLTCLVEACFFPYYLYLFTQVNAHNKALQHFACDRAVRFNLVKNCFQAMALAAPPGSRMALDPEKYIRKVIEGWFLDVPILQIYRGNFASWCGWAFFGKDIDAMTAEEVQENDTILAYVEQMAGWRFPEGLNRSLVSARLTLDPVFATQRPFFFYASIWAVNSLTHVGLYSLGYRRMAKFCTPAANVYHRPPLRPRAGAEGSKGSGDPGGKEGKGLPIVFVHGIGIGFAHYMGLVYNFPTDVDVYLLEWPHVAMQMATDVPTVTETVDTVLGVLGQGGHDKACFVAHSLGSTAVSWMLHHPEGRKRVAASVLLDPVTFLLCDPTVATTFVYKQPTNTVDFLMHFFLSRELFISNALSRHFNWSHNIMFVEDLQAAGLDSPSLSLPPSPLSSPAPRPQRSGSLNLSEIAEEAERRERKALGGGGSSNSSSSSSSLKHTIVLSSHDSIVPIGPVSRYLEGKRREGHESFEVIFFHGHHGEMMVVPAWVRLIGEKIKVRAGSRDQG